MLVTLIQPVLHRAIRIYSVKIKFIKKGEDEKTKIPNKADLFPIGLKVIQNLMLAKHSHLL